MGEFNVTNQTVTSTNNTNNKKAVTKKDYSEEIKKAIRERISNNRLSSYDDLNKITQSSISLFGNDIVTDEQKNQAYYDYSEGLLLQYYDKDGDGKVTVEEFAQKEAQGSLDAMHLQAEHLDQTTRKMMEEDPEQLKFFDEDGDGSISQAEYEKGTKKLDLSCASDNINGLYKTIAERSGNLFSQNLDMNGNGYIDAEELAFFNKNADACDGKQDGTIKNVGESAMFTAVTGMNADNKEYNRVINKYLAGETLTAEEQKTLEASQKTIRTAMGNAAGIKPQE